MNCNYESTSMRASFGHTFITKLVTVNQYTCVYQFFKKIPSESVRVSIVIYNGWIGSVL